MSTTPTLNPQIIGQAESAHKPILDRILARTGTTPNQWFALTLTAGNGGAIESGQLVARLTGARKIEDAQVAAAIAELTAAQLMEARAGQRLRLTDAGQARHLEIRAAVDEVVVRVYGDIPAEDLATAARVLRLITARLDAELGS
jgi:DNA-binding MarR family transcriptional regulator